MKTLTNRIQEILYLRCILHLILMKHQKLSLISILIAALIGLFSSCKKANGNTSLQCHITDVETPTAGRTYLEHLEYDNNNKLLSITSTPMYERRIFSYGDNQIFIIDSNNNAMVEIDTVTLNSKGLISTIKQHWLGMYYIDSMSYNSDNELIEMDSWGPSMSLEKQTYVWKAGNPIVRISNSTADSFTYYRNENNTIGDSFWFNSYMRWGANSIMNINPVAQIGHMSILYSYNGDGKIISMSTPNSPTTLYTYSCN